ncbi:DUF397 domain-containing protein [Streptomyces sp. NPDC002088]|uniref:DUF397 domain-containing protein n=1 Tax=Streptomyces sp. NPDC002088 TaxID=3154665 RepID=UPI00331E6674
MKSTGSHAGSTRWSGPPSASKRPSNFWNHSPEGSGAIDTHRTYQPSTDIAPAQAWIKSSYSSDGTGNCVEIADLVPQVAVRDSKNMGGPALIFPRGSWRSFVISVSDMDVASAACG